MAYQVVRPFRGARDYAIGERVDAAGWRWLAHLVERRYLVPCADDATAPSSSPPGDDHPPPAREGTARGSRRPEG